MPYPRDEYPLPRPYVCDGSHASQRVASATWNPPPEYNSTTIEILICEDPTCAALTALCEHSTNEWNNAETVLSCTFCGKDGT